MAHSTKSMDEKKYVGKTVIYGGENGSLRMELMRELLNDGVTNLGIIDNEKNDQIIVTLQNEYPGAHILYESQDLLNRSLTKDLVTKMKNTFQTEIEYFIIDSQKLPDDKVQQIQDSNFFIAVNLTMVAIDHMNAKTVRGAKGGVISMLIPVENPIPNIKTFPSYNAKKHALTGYMIALSDEYEKICKLSFLAIAYKYVRYAADVPRKVRNVSPQGPTGTPKRSITPGLINPEQPSTSAAARAAVLQSQPSTSLSASTSPAITLTQTTGEDVHMEDLSDLPKTPIKRPHRSPSPGPSSGAAGKSDVKSDVELIASIIGTTNTEYVLWTVHMGDKKSLHFAKYCP